MGWGGWGGGSDAAAAPLMAHHHKMSTVMLDVFALYVHLENERLVW